MGLIFKKQCLSVLKYLDTKPVFRRVFYWIHEIRKDELNTDRFIAVEIGDDFILGTYSYKNHRLWKMFAEGEFETEQSELIEKLLPFYNTFIDIGAHIGYYTCLVAKISKDIDIHTFEPNPENIKSLRKNVAVNHINNCHVYPIGLGAKKEKLVMYGKDAMGSVVKETYDINSLPQEKVEVDIDTLDNYTKIIKKEGGILMKIDVEGNEYSLLKGSSNFFKVNKPSILLMEISNRWSTQDNPNYLNTFKLLDGMNFKSYKISDGNFMFIRKDLVGKMNNILSGYTEFNFKDINK